MCKLDLVGNGLSTQEEMRELCGLLIAPGQQGKTPRKASWPVKGLHTVATLTCDLAQSEGRVNLLYLS